MTRALLAPENRIVNQLRELGCSQRNFAPIAGYAYGTFAGIIAGARDFTPAEAERLFELLQRMRELQAKVDVPVNWSQTEKVGRALANHLIADLADST